jgi:hypothetical protein
MRVLSLSKFSLIKPGVFLAAGSAFPLTMPGVFSKAVAAVSKLPLYSLSSFYGPLLSTYIAPVLAVVSVVSAPLSTEVSVASFRVAGMHSVEAPVDRLLDTLVDASVTPFSSVTSPFSSSVTPSKAGAQGHTHVLDVETVVPSPTAVSWGVKYFSHMANSLDPQVLASQSLNFMRQVELGRTASPNLNTSATLLPTLLKMDLSQESDKDSIGISLTGETQPKIQPTEEQRYSIVLEKTLSLIKNSPAIHKASRVKADFFESANWFFNMNSKLKKWVMVVFSKIWNEDTPQDQMCESVSCQRLSVKVEQLEMLEKLGSILKLLVVQRLERGLNNTFFDVSFMEKPLEALRSRGIIADKDIDDLYDARD